MRLEWMPFLPILLALTACGAQDADVRRSPEIADAVEDVWIYDEQSDFHGVLPLAVREMRAKDPATLAHAVCHALGGGLDFMQPPEGRDRVGINCAFVENGAGMTAPFGELRRIRTNPAGG